MLKLRSTNPFLLPIHELDGQAQEGWNIFQTALIKSATNFMFIDEMDSQAQNGWNIFQSTVFRSVLSYRNISVVDCAVIHSTVHYADLFNDRPLGISLERQQAAVAELILCLDLSNALNKMLDQEI